MRGLPCYCPNCKIAFLAPNIIGGSATVQLSGNRVRCPECRGWASITDGTFSLRDGRSTLVDGPPLTRAIVDLLVAAVRAPGVTAGDVLAFQSIAQAVASGEMDADTAEAKVREIGQPFANLWERVKPETGHQWLMFILTLIGLILAALPHLNGDKAESGAQTPDPAVELHQFHEYIEQAVHAALQDGFPTGFSAEARPQRPSKSSPRSTQLKVPVMGENRHARRRAAALERKKRT